MNTITNFWDYMSSFTGLELARKQVELADKIRLVSVNSFQSKLQRRKFTHLEKETIYKHLNPAAKDAQYECLAFFAENDTVNSKQLSETE